LVQSTYEHLAPGTPLWIQGNQFMESAGPLAPDAD
jgi:hypothetical protein